jgi:hypothetical protein
MEQVVTTVGRPSTRHPLCESIALSIIHLLQRESLWCEIGLTDPSRITCRMTGRMVMAKMVADTPHFTIRT